jgi:hypothetical protein
LHSKVPQALLVQLARQARKVPSAPPGQPELPDRRGLQAQLALLAQPEQLV